jgi:hypothetical protein
VSCRKPPADDTPSRERLPVTYLVRGEREANQLADTLEFLLDQIHYLTQPTGSFRTLLDPDSTYGIEQFQATFDRLHHLLRTTHKIDP